MANTDGPSASSVDKRRVPRPRLADTVARVDARSQQEAEWNALGTVSMRGLAERGQPRVLSACEDLQALYDESAVQATSRNDVADGAEGDRSSHWRRSVRDAGFSVPSPQLRSARLTATTSMKADNGGEVAWRLAQSSRLGFTNRDRRRHHSLGLVVVE